MLGVVASLDAPLIDLFPVLAAADDPKDWFPFQLPGHYNPAGYRAVATAIASDLQLGERVGDGSNARR